MSYARTYVLDYAERDGEPERFVCYDIRPDGDKAVTLLVVGATTRRLITTVGVQRISDFDTGEILASITEAYCAVLALSKADIEVIRGRDKWLWDKPYMLRVIENHYRNKLFELFNYCCFKCGRPGRMVHYKDMEHVPFWRGLERDHHIPISLGGRLVPGNIVVLCPDCNNKKHERDPRLFYSVEELVALRPLLAKEADAVSFKFDSAQCREDRRAYLLSVGIGEQLVEQVLHNKMHRYFIGAGSGESVEFTVTVSGDLDDLLVQLSDGKD